MSNAKWWEINGPRRQVYSAVHASGEQGAALQDLVATVGLGSAKVSNLLHLLKTDRHIVLQGGCFWVVNSNCVPVPQPAAFRPLPRASADAAAPVAGGAAAADGTAAQPAAAARHAAAPVVKAATLASFDLTPDGRFSIAWGGLNVLLPRDVTRDMFRHLDRLGGLALEEALDEHQGGAA